MSTSSTSEIIITANAAQAIAELQKENAALRAGGDAAIQAGKAKERAAEGGYKALAKERQLLESLKTPAEKHNETVGMLGKLYERNVIGIDKFRAGVAASAAVLQRHNDKVAALAAASKSATDASAATLQSAESAGVGAAKSALKFVGAATGIGSIVGGLALAAAQLRREYEAMKEERKTAADRQIDLAGARQGLRDAAGGDAERAIKDIRSMSKETGVPQKELSVAATGALSSKGDLPYDAAMEATKLASIHSPADAQQREELIRAMMAQKQRSPDTSMKDILGFLVGAMLESPVKNMQMFARNIAPGIASSSLYGSSPEYSAALHASVGQGANDYEGAKTRSALSNFQKQLLEASPKSLTSTEERLDWLHSDDKKAKRARAKMLGPLQEQMKQFKEFGLHAESEALMPLMGLIEGGDNPEWVRFQNTRARMPTLKGAGAIVDKTYAERGKDPLERNAESQRRDRVNAENQRLENIKGGAEAVESAGLEENLKASGISGVELMARKGRYEVSGGLAGGRDSIEASLKELKSRQEYLRATVQDVHVGEWGSSVTEVKPTEDALRRADALEEAIQAKIRLLEQWDKEQAEAAPGAGGAVLPSMREAPKWADIKERPATIGKPRQAVLRQNLGVRTSARDAQDEWQRRQNLQMQQGLNDPGANLESLSAPMPDPSSDLLSQAQPYGFNLGATDARTNGRNRRAGIGPVIVSAESQRNPRVHRRAAAGPVIMAAEDQGTPREYAKAAAGPVIQSNDQQLKLLEKIAKHAEGSDKTNAEMARAQRQSPSVTPPAPRFTQPPAAQLGRRQSYPQSGV